MKFLFVLSDKTDGNMSFAWGSEDGVTENRKKFLAKHGLKIEDCIIADLAHDDGITVVGKGDTDTKARADALITNTKGVILFMLTADCFPVAYYDHMKNVVALVHLGWKPTHLKLAGKVIEKMKQEFDSSPSDVRIFFGPGIHKDSYIVENPQQKDMPEWQAFLEDTLDGTTIDLIGFNKKVLVEAGVPDSNIIVSPVDTAISPDYFSHYRAMRTNEPEGRFATITALV